MSAQERPLRLILPEGPVAGLVMEALRAGGVEVPVLDAGRSPQGLRCDTEATLGAALELWCLHPDDIPAYVEGGVAELGVASVEAIEEADARVYRPHTFGFEAAPVVLAAPQQMELSSLVRLHRLRVATRYRRLTRAHFAARGWPAELVSLAGDPARAVALGLADAALLVLRQERALEDYGLCAVEEVGRSWFKLIANRAAGRSRMALIERLVARLAGSSPAPPA
jgi:ATP phosphoribosyltransferase